MDIEFLKKTQNKQVQKLNKVTKRIQKARKDLKILEKEAAEFQEIQKLLETTDEETENVTEADSLPEEIKLLDCSVIPMRLPGVKVFHSEWTFSLFKEEDCFLKNFLKEEKEFGVFSQSKSVPSEECFRNLISYHLIVCGSNRNEKKMRKEENLLPKEGKCSSISLYVLYLMSVHEEPDFVASCFHFLTHHKFSLQLKDLLPVFVNFGAKSGDLFDFCEKTFAERFPGKNGNDRRGSPAVRFPLHNLEMVGRILLQYVNEDLVVIDASVKAFVRGLVKITLDPRIRSGVLLPLYSAILATLCSKLQTHFPLEEILTWIHDEGEHLLNQVEISQNISRATCERLHDALVLKILSGILRSKLSPAEPSLKMSHVKAALKNSCKRDLLPLELYSVLLLINDSLPTLTATLKQSVEINSLVACLEQKISKVEDSVDLMRLKLETAKVGNSLTNSRSKGLAAGPEGEETMCSN